jgi:hypothetical protein
LRLNQPDPLGIAGSSSSCVAQSYQPLEDKRIDMTQLYIHDWDMWQTYRRDRGQPPWIKVHRCLMRDHKWVALSDAQKGQLISMWILAADNNGQLPDDPTLVQKLCYLDNPPDLEYFVKQGLVDRDANLTPQRRQSDAPEAEAETEAEVEKKQKTKPKPKRFVPPTIDQVKQYCRERNNSVDAERFVDFYASKGWLVGKNKMKDWKASVRTWEKSETATPERKDPANRRLT